MIVGIRRWSSRDWLWRKSWGALPWPYHTGSRQQRKSGGDPQELQVSSQAVDQARKIVFFFSFAINTKINKVSTVVIFYIDNVLKSLPMNIRLEHAASGAEVLLPVFQISVG